MNYCTNKSVSNASIWFNCKNLRSEMQFVRLTGEPFQYVAHNWTERHRIACFRAVLQVYPHRKARVEQGTVWFWY